VIYSYSMNTQKGFASIVWVVIIAVLLTGGIYVFYASTGRPLPFSGIDNPPNLIRVQDIERGKQSTTNTSDWKTYRNEEYGFEFQSPARRIELFPASSADYLYEDREFYGIYGISNQDYAARIDVYPDTPLAVVLQDNRFINTARVLSEITKNSILWTKVEDSDYLFEKNKMTYHIAGEQDLTAPILSTFRFTK